VVIRRRETPKNIKGLGVSDRNLPSFSGRNHLQNIRNLGSSARMSRFGTEFDPLKKGLGIVDVNVLYHAQIWMPGKWYPVIENTLSSSATEPFAWYTLIFYT